MTVPYGLQLALILLHDVLHAGGFGAPAGSAPFSAATAAAPFGQPATGQVTRIDGCDLMLLLIFT